MYCREYLHRFLRLTQCNDFQVCFGTMFNAVDTLLILIGTLEAMALVLVRA